MVKELKNISIAKAEEKINELVSQSGLNIGFTCNIKSTNNVLHPNNKMFIIKLILVRDTQYSDIDDSTHDIEEVVTVRLYETGSISTTQDIVNGCRKVYSFLLTQLKETLTNEVKILWTNL